MPGFLNPDARRVGSDWSRRRPLEAARHPPNGPAEGQKLRRSLRGECSLLALDGKAAVLRRPSQCERPVLFGSRQSEPPKYSPRWRKRSAELVQPRPLESAEIGKAHD